jgi:hypothetical protein
MKTKAFKEGRAAWKRNSGSVMDCHYRRGSKQRQDWFRGYAAEPALEMRKANIEKDAEETVWGWFAEAHPHEAHAKWPERFWRFFHAKRPKVSKDRMKQLLKET